MAVTVSMSILPSPSPYVADKMAMFVARERLASSNLFYNAASTQRVADSLLIVVEHLQVRD